MVVWYSDHHLNTGLVFKWQSEYPTKFSLGFKWHKSGNQIPTVDEFCRDKLAVAKMVTGCLSEAKKVLFSQI